jgi:Zn-dependent metalloprotease
MTCTCSIIPPDILKRMAVDERLPESSRRALLDTAAIDARVRLVREQARRLTRVSGTAMHAGLAIATTPAVLVYDCMTTTTLPGRAVSNPGASTDISARRVFEETREVARFYKQIFGRNSIDGAGMTLQSSVHYDRAYANAQWNGFQMIYGDGDGQTFVDLTGSNDVIGHELTHGVTQHSLQLQYNNDEPGALNESMSDVFGSMFRQWRAGQDVATADWLIGSDIMGPAVRALGITCLRDLSNPGGAHCLSRQPKHFSNFAVGMDPHESSGIPNHAFFLACQAIGGNSWDVVGKIWYHAVTGGASPRMKMSAFAARTRAAAVSLFSGQASVATAIDDAWQHVGL